MALFHRPPPILAWLLAVSAALACLPGTALATPRVEGDRLSVDAGDVDGYLQAQFPQTHDVVRGLLALTVSRPAVALPPGDRADLQFDLALAPAGGTATPLGRVRMSSALRYDGQRQAFFLESPSVDGFVAANGDGQLDAQTRKLVNAWLVDYARREPVYRLPAGAAALMGTLQVRDAGVDGGRLVVRFDRDIQALVPPQLLQPH